MSVREIARAAIGPVADRLTDEKITMGLFLLFLVLAGIMADLFAFQNGAVATISQVWLGLNRKFWVLTYLLAIACGILIQHVSVPRDPGVTPDSPFWPQTLMWTPFFWLGMWITSKLLYQLPNVD